MSKPQEVRPDILDLASVPQTSGEELLWPSGGLSQVVGRAVENVDVAMVRRRRKRMREVGETSEVLSSDWAVTVCVVF